MSLDTDATQVVIHKSEKQLLIEDEFATLEDSKLEAEPLYKKVLKGAVTGTGFLSDAFDLFIINVVMVIMKEIYGEQTVKKYEPYIAASVLVGAVIGQLSFGILADKVGRRIGFIITLTLVIIGSIASGLSFEYGPINVFLVLCFWRFVLGVGVGGEYPLSATITAENSTTSNRGKNTAAVFSMQGVGSLLATVVAYVFYITLPDRVSLVWRLALGFGAVPGLLMFYFRVKMEETPRFASAKQGTDVEASPNIRTYSGQPPAKRSSDEGFRRTLRLLGANWKRLVGTAGNWFILDITFYANGLFSASILSQFATEGDTSSTLKWNVFLALMALPGYWVAVFLIERIGRKPLQLFGFIILGTVYLIMGLLYPVLKSVPEAFFVMYGLTFFVTNAGANPTTYVIPSESFATEIRATCHGFSAAAGKLGAVIGASAMAPLKDTYGLETVLIVCAMVAFSGSILTFFFTIETMGKSLEQLSKSTSAESETHDSFRNLPGGIKGRILRLYYRFS